MTSPAQRELPDFPSKHGPGLQLALASLPRLPWIDGSLSASAATGWTPRLISLANPVNEGPASRRTILKDGDVSSGTDGELGSRTITRERAVRLTSVLQTMNRVDPDTENGDSLLRNVSRETRHRLERYLGLLLEWNARINLIGRTTIANAWSRHILDSVQLLHLSPPEARTWLDLGSGAGLPGVPVAIAADELRPQVTMTLVESDRRKVAFLQTVARELDLRITIEARRIETVRPRTYDVVSARALAPLDRLCALAHRFKGSSTVFLFPKGAHLDSELTRAQKHWHIRADRIPSATNPDGSILKIVELEPKHDA